MSFDQPVIAPGKERFFILKHAMLSSDVGTNPKTELVVVHSIFADNYDDAKLQFGSWLEKMNAVNEHFLVMVLGRGAMIIDMKLEYKEDGK